MPLGIRAITLLSMLIIVQYLFPLANAQNVISWQRTTYPPNSDGVVEIADRDLSLNPMTITTFQTSVYSDSDLSGIRLEMVETAPNSGIFLGNVYFSTNFPSSGNRLHVSEGDTVTAEYVDRTLPPPYLDTQQLIFRATALIAFNSSSYASRNNLVCGYSLNGHLLYGSNSCKTEGIPTILSQAKGIATDIIAYLANTDKEYYILMLNHFQCHECNLDVSKLCKYDQNGNLLPSFTEEQKKVLLDLQANYSFAICPFTAKSITMVQSNTVEINGTFHEDPLKQFKSGFAVTEVKCSANYILTIKSEDGSPACVKPSTVRILVERGWAKFESAQSNHASNAQTNPFGIAGLIIYYGGGPCGVGPCPLNTFNLKITSNYTAYLLGYNICDGNSCATRDSMAILLPISNVSTPNFKTIALPEDLNWKYNDTIHIQVIASAFPENETAASIDLGNSTTVP